MATANTTDETIAAQVVRVPEMFGFLIDRYESKLDKYIYRKTGLERDQRADILQEVFIRAYQNINSFDTSMSFNAWIYRICHNTLINDWKRNKRYREALSIDGEYEYIINQLAEDESVSAELDAKMLQKNIKEAIGQLSDRYKTIVTLFYLEGLSYEEISTVLQMPTGTVGTQLARARAKLIMSLKNKQ